MLRPEVIAAELAGQGDRIAGIEVVQSTGSTNDYLAAEPVPGNGCARICVAEEQTAGRGSRGRSWYSRPGGSICLSLVREPPLAVTAMTQFPLVVAVATAEALAAAGVDGVGLKWPNDLVWEGRKLGGILIEWRGSGRAARTVVGIGLNYDLGPDDCVKGRAVADVTAAAGPGGPARDALAGRVAAATVAACDEVARWGAADYIARYWRFDVLSGRCVRVETPQMVVYGQSLGVTENGALAVATDSGRQLFLTGEASVRPNP